MCVMNLKTYCLQKRGRQSELAKAIGAHASDLSDWVHDKRPIPFPYGSPIESASGGLVTRQEMFPHDWRRLWPELAASASA